MCVSFQYVILDIKNEKNICFSTVQLRLRIDCEAVTVPGRRGGSSELVATSREPQKGLQGATLMPITSWKQEASAPADFAGDNITSEGIPTADGVLNFIALKYFQVVDPSNPEELNDYLKYLRDVRKVLFKDAQQGSLIITVECSTLEILEGLWEDYCSGHLNKMAQNYLVTKDILKAFGPIEVKLATTIRVDEYKACREYFLQSAGESAFYILEIRLFIGFPAGELDLEQEKKN